MGMDNCLVKLFSKRTGIKGNTTSLVHCYFPATLDEIRSKTLTSLDEHTIFISHSTVQMTRPRAQQFSPDFLVENLGQHHVGSPNITVQIHENWQHSTQLGSIDCVAYQQGYHYLGI